MLTQQTIMQHFQFSHTSPEQFASHWICSSAALIDCSAAIVWLEANNILGASWSLVDASKLRPSPPPPLIQPKGVKAPIPPRGILRQKQTNLISLRFGKFCFHNSTKRKPMIAADHSQSKAPRNF